MRNESLIRLVIVSLKTDSGFASSNANVHGNYDYGWWLGVRVLPGVFAHTCMDHGIKGNNVYLAKHVYLAKNVYLTDSERATNEEASIRENELSTGTLTNPQTHVTNQHSFRIRTRGAKGP